VRRHLCIDIDNVLAETDIVMRRVIRAFTKGDVDLEYTDVREFDYDKCRDCDGHSITREQWHNVHDRFSKPSTLLSIQPVPGVQRHLARLSSKFELHLATSRLRSARAATIKWLDVHGFPEHDLHFLKHGQKHAVLGRFAAAIEDHYEQAAALAACGTPAFLLEHPWNKGKPKAENVAWVKSWPQLIRILLKA
jgi:uncharacterized HAD superfamily protein